MKTTASLHRTIIVLLACFVTPHLLAFNKPGHMLVAAIAFQDLERTGDQEVIRKTIALLKDHPYYTNSWLAKVNSQAGVGTANHDQFVFMYAARWADDARGTSYDKERWHYINLPFKPAGQPASITPPAPPSENITNAIALNTAKVRQSNARRKDKAVALAWLYHLYGDIHQPLHTATLFTVDYPAGDRGGTRFYIRRTANSEGTLSLHTYWDGIITSSERFATIKNEATRLLNVTSLQRNDFPQLANKNPNLWASSESLSLARTVGYLNGQLHGSTDKEDGEPLPADYRDKAKPIAEQQIVLAGYRLADFLRSLFQST
jgi:hypothetical protein